MKKIFFFLAALTLSFTAQAAIINAHPNGGEDGVLTWFIGQAAEGDTVLLADGEYIQTYSVDVQTPGIVIKAAEGAKPIIKAESYFKIHKTTIWEGITFDGLNKGEHALVFRGTNAKNLILKDCEIKNYPKCLVYCDDGYHVDSLIIDNCLLHDAGRVAVYVAASSLADNVHGCDYFKMTNSTVYEINSTGYGAGVIDIRTNGSQQGDYTEVIIDHVTMYNAKSTGDYGAIASYKSTDVKISNTIVMNPEVYTSYSFRIYGGVVDNCMSYNCAGKSGATYNNCIEGKDPLFVNPAQGDFNLQPGSPAIGAATDGTNLGDPRWKVAAAELTFAMTAPAADVEATDLYTIKWNVLDPAGDATIKLEYKTEEGEWTLIEENIPTTKSAYDWNIRKMAAQTVALRGTLTNATETIESVAAGKLTIVPEAVAPRPVRNLVGEVVENTLTLTWINPDQAYEVSETLETLESAESYISNDGTAEVTLSGDKKEVSVAYNTTAAWHMAGVKVPVTADYVNTLACELKRDAADGTQIQVTIEQNGFDWWYLIIDDIPTEWTKYEFTEFEKLGWHNNSDANVLDGTNVTAIYFATNHGSGVTGTLSLRNLTLNGAVPAVADYAKTVVCASTTDYPAAIVASEVVYEGTASTCALTIDPTEDYYVSVFAQDDLGNTSVAAQYMYEAPEVVEPEKPEPTYTENKLNPYAFGLESKLSEDKETLTVTYRLNNSNATSVNVLVYNGEEVVATVAGTTTIGKNTVEVATADLPGGVELTWSVEVNGTSVKAPTQETKIYSIYHPSSVDIDNNPENPTFGMLLVNEAMQSVKTTTKETPYISKGFGAGIFAFTPSFDLMPNGELPGYNGGKTFSTTTNMFAPRRIRFSKDGRIFATAQDGSGEYLWEINPENLNEWTTVFQGTNDGYTLKDAEGNFIAGTNSGFDVRGEGENLQLLMLSASLPGAQVGSFKCHTYDLGTATTWATAPTKEIPGANYMLVTNQSNVQFDKDGGVWYISYRGTTTEKEPGLVHINKDGVEDYKELRHMTRNAGFRFNHDFTKVIIAGNNGASKKATIYAISEDANGAPVLTQETVIDMSAVGANLNDFAWDYAGNLYACGNSSEKLAAWAMPYSGKVSTPAAAKYAFQLEGTENPDQGIHLTATGLETKLEDDGSYTLQGQAVVNGDESNLMDFMLCVYPTEGYTDAFLNNYSVMIFGAPTPGAFVENTDGTFTYTAQIEDTDGTVYNINISGTIKTGGSEYTELGDKITNMTFDTENMVITGGPSAEYAIKVVLKLGEDKLDGTYTLSSESSVTIRERAAEFVEGYVYNMDLSAPSAVAVVKVNWDGMKYEFTLRMSAPVEATKVVVENATIEINKYLLFGDTYDYALKMTGNWLNPEDGLTYPVLVDVPVYYPEATEPSTIHSTVTVGGEGDDDPWLGFGEGELTITTVGNTITATGIVENPMNGIAIDITISGSKTPTAIDNATITVKPVKVIKNGQLIIINNDVEYSAQGQVIK